MRMDVGECVGSATAASAVIATTDVGQCVESATAASAVNAATAAIRTLRATIIICIWTDCGATCRVWFDAVTSATSAGITITRILF